MKKLLCFILLLPLSSFAQHRITPNKDVIEVPQQFRQHIPEGFAAMDTVYGDLNKDKYRDIALVLKKTDEDTITEAPRPLLLFTGETDGSFKFAGRNDNVVMCIGCGGIFGDPYTGISIKDGYFSVEHYGGSNRRWTHIITFKYSAKDKTWLLYKEGGDSFPVWEPDKVETKIKTAKDFGKVLFKDYKSDY